MARDRTLQQILSHSIKVFKEKKSHRDMTLSELLVTIRNNKKIGIKIFKRIFDFAFKLDGRVYLIKGGSILGEHWTHDMRTVIDKCEVLPQLYAAMNNVLAEVQSALDETKIKYDSWVGKTWKNKEDGELGLYGATVAQVNAAINNLPDAVEYRWQMAELKTIVQKLKGLLRAIEMQHSIAIAVLYNTRRSDAVFQDSIGSMITRPDGDSLSLSDIKVEKRKKSRKKKKGSAKK